MDPEGVPFVRAQARALAKFGHRVTVLFTQPYSLKTVLKKKRLPFKWTDQVIEGVREIQSYRPKTHMRRIDELTRLRLGKRGLKRFISQGITPDIIHVHVFLAGRLAVWASKKYKIPLVATEHFTGFARGIIEPWEMKRAKELYLFSSHNIAVSKSFSTLLEEQTGAVFHVLSNMVDTDCFHPKEKTLSSIYSYLFVGYLHRKKNPDMLIEAFKDVFIQKPDSRLYIVGDGEMKPLLIKLIQKYELEDVVHLSGFLDAQGVSNMMSKSDCLLLPSSFETFGIVVIEAFSMGLPAIVTRSGGPENFVTHDKGIIIDADKSQLVKAMLEIRSRDWNHQEIRNYAVHNYSEKAVCQKLDSIYRELSKP